MYTQVKKLCTQVVKPLQYKVFIDIYLFSIVQGLLRMPNEKSRFQEPKISQFSVKPNLGGLVCTRQPLEGWQAKPDGVVLFIAFKLCHS